MKKFIASIIILIGIFVNIVSANPIYSTKEIDLTIGSRGYDFEYLNSGTLVGTYSGNIASSETDIHYLEELIETALSLSDLELTLTDVTVTNSDDDWQYKYEDDQYTDKEDKDGLSQ